MNQPVQKPRHGSSGAVLLPALGLTYNFLQMEECPRLCDGTSLLGEARRFSAALLLFEILLYLEVTIQGRRPASFQPVRENLL
jgi:hypothetical protein